ncbi:MAG: efflux RND transporter periplasmic adaptor subunit, partial [Candidatus Latescibacterota bacterium]
ECSSMKKTILIIIGVLFFGFLAWRIINLVTSKSPTGGMRPGGRPPVAVQVAKPGYEPIQDIHLFTGSVYPMNRYVVAPKVSGRVIEIRKRIGDPVRKGEVIARIDDAEYQQAVLEAEANLKIAQASLAEIRGQAELVKQELDRAQSLREKGISSTSELDAAVTNNTAQQARLKLAQAQVEQREAALNSARIRLSETGLAAPEPGLVGERFVDEGALLSPNAPVITVVGIDRVIVRTTIIERDYGQIKVGQEAAIEVDAFPNEHFTGTVSRIAPMLQEASRVAQMEVEVTNSSHKLKPGMFTRVRVVLARNESAQVIPAAALVSSHGENGGHGVYVIETNSEPLARWTPVETGIITPEKVEIVSPKLEGMVVTLGHHLLSDGSSVILPGQESGGKPGAGTGGGRGGNPAGSEGRPGR